MAVAYKEIVPEVFLKDYIECFWEHKNPIKKVEHTILPDGFFELIAEFKNGILFNIYIKGIHTEPLNITLQKNQTIYGIRFKYIAAEYFFKKPITELLNKTKSLPLDFWNLNKLSDNQFDQFISDISYQLNNYINHTKQFDIRKTKLSNLIYQSNIFSVENLSQKVGWSSRQINRYFTTQVGMPLKEYLKIVRCSSSYNYFSHGTFDFIKGFYDQSHFIKEIKKYCKTTPGMLLKNDNNQFLQIATHL